MSDDDNTAQSEAPRPEFDLGLMVNDQKCGGGFPTF